MAKIPQEIKQTLEDYAEQAEIDGAILTDALISVYKSIRASAPDVPKEDVWPIALDKTYAQEVRDILQSKAEIFVQMFVGASNLRDRNNWRKGEAMKQKRKNLDDAIENGWVNEDGTPLAANGRILRPWWSRQILSFSIKRDKLAENPDDPEMAFFLGGLGGRLAQLFGTKPKKGPDPRLQPELGHWYRIRWTEMKDEHPVEVETDDGGTVVFRQLGKSAKVTNFGTLEEAVNIGGMEGLKTIANNMPGELVIAIEKESIDEWAAEHIIVDVDENGNDVRDYNAFGLVFGRLMQMNVGDAFGSIVLKSLTSNEELRITCDAYTAKKALVGVGIGSTIAAWIQPYLRNKDEAEEHWEATGLGMVATRVIPPLDLDEDEDESEDDEDIIDEDEDDIEEVE